jgi:GNAT superfamily N-acetyltransferase
MHVRRIALEELNALLSLYAHLHNVDPPLPSEDVVQSVWRELIESTYHTYFGGYVGNELISSCTLTTVPNLTRGCRPYGVIENVVTHASHRRRGYGKTVLEHALAHAWSAGCYKVMLLTGRKDEGTFRFYESVGFDRHEKQAFIAKPKT